MRYFTIGRFGKPLALLCTVTLLSACAVNMTVSKEELIEKRAAERWETLLGGDLAGAYEYLSPGYRSSVSSLQYQRSILLQKVKWSDAKVVGSNCAELTCSVNVSVDYTVFGALPGVKSFTSTQIITESWVYTDKQWYLVPE